MMDFNVVFISKLVNGYGYTVRKSNCAILIFDSFLNGGQLVKDKHSHRRKFLPLLEFEGISYSEKKCCKTCSPL